MHTLSFNTKKRTADFDIHDSDELLFLQKAVNLLHVKQSKHIHRLERDGSVPQHEHDRLVDINGLFMVLNHVGPSRLGYKDILILEDAMNTGLVTYEKTVTDNPNDPIVKKYKEFIKLLHHVGRKDLRKNR